MLPSAFEKLPDEILMMIMRYTGDIYEVCRSFSGLNRRINNILYDRRLHLFTDFLLMNINDARIDHYYTTDVFYDICQQLLSKNAIENDESFRHHLQSLMAFHITHTYCQSLSMFETSIKHFQSVRMYQNSDKIVQLDQQLEIAFIDLQTSTKPLNRIQEIEDLVLNQGAKLECTIDQHSTCRFIEAVNHLLLPDFMHLHLNSQRTIVSLVHMLKILIISNPTLLSHRICTRNDDYYYSIYYVLLYAIYRLKHFTSSSASIMQNLQRYRATMDLLLFSIACLKYVPIKIFWRNQNFFDILQMTSSIQLNGAYETFVSASQIQILKLLLDENIFDETIYWNVEYSERFQHCLKQLITNNRFDVILFIFNYNEQTKSFFQNSWNSQIIVDLMIMGNPARKQSFRSLLNHRSLGPWLATNTDLLFVLLRRKQYTLLKDLFHQSPLLIHRLDDDGNDPLLYLCLKVHGCRHRFVEYLIQIGSHIQRRNSYDESFIEALHLERNVQLLERLIEHQIIQIDHTSNEKKVQLA